MLYEMPDLTANGISCYETAAVFDPCASRGNKELQMAVRNLAKTCNVTLHALQSEQEDAQCCSWGGHGYCVNQLFVRQQVKSQIEQHGDPYICYCTNCRDIFASKGKDCRHILDYILGINEAVRPAPTVTQRRENRRKLKKELAKRYGLSFEMTEVDPGMKLHMTNTVAQKISSDLILEEDLIQVVLQSEKSGRLLLNPETGHLVGHWKIGYLTYWAEFSRCGEGEYEIHNAYTHRMTIKHEEM
jgi:hypothetical protein